MRASKFAKLFNNPFIIASCVIKDSALLTPIFLELPVSVIQWAYLARLEPARDAVKVERMLPDISTQHVVAPEVLLTLQIPQATVHSSLVAEA